MINASPETQHYDTIVIGGGPAGFFAAITAAEGAPDRRVVLLEGSRKFLSKVLISGGGRCNVTNDTPEVTQLIQNYPRGHRELRGPFSRFGTAETVAWFTQRGVPLKTEPDRRMFPVTDNSRTIAECLIAEAKRAGVLLKLSHRVVEVQPYQHPGSPNRFVVACKGKTPFSAHNVVIATGGARSGFDLTASLRHTIVPPVPSLFTFTVDHPLLEGLQGVSFPNALIALKTADGFKARQHGPLLITHWGLSGPAIIKLSSLAARHLFNAGYQAELTVRFVSSGNTEEVFSSLQRYRTKHPDRQVGSHPLFDLPKRFWVQALSTVTPNATLPWQQLSKTNLRTLATVLTASPLQMIAKGVFKEEFVTCGGVLLKEVNFKTMESKLHPGLYFAGELLDIDGVTGGFNFQSAWTTGFLAGESCALPPSPDNRQCPISV